jgi:hypothetical protein
MFYNCKITNSDSSLWIWNFREMVWSTFKCKINLIIYRDYIVVTYLLCK